MCLLHLRRDFAANVEYSTTTETAKLQQKESKKKNGHCKTGHHLIRGFQSLLLVRRGSVAFHSFIFSHLCANTVVYWCHKHCPNGNVCPRDDNVSILYQASPSRGGRRRHSPIDIKIDEINAAEPSCTPGTRDAARIYLPVIQHCCCH